MSFFISHFKTTDIHDVEFTSSLPIPAGNHTLAFTNRQIAKEYGLAEEDKGKIWGDGDLKLLNALRTLKLLKEEGKIRMFGISGRYNNHCGVSSRASPSRSQRLIMNPPPPQPPNPVQTQDYHFQPSFDLQTSHLTMVLQSISSKHTLIKTFKTPHYQRTSLNSIPLEFHI